jgi:hypothetical protein
VFEGKTEHMSAVIFKGQETIPVAQIINKDVYCTCWEKNRSRLKSE